MRATSKSRTQFTDLKSNSPDTESSEEQFHELANNMPNLAWMADADGWIYWYNSRWYEYTGTTPKDMQGWGWQSVHNPKQLPRVLKKWQMSIKTGKPFDMVFPLKGKDGDFRSFLTRIIPIKDKHGSVIRWFGTNTDITAQEETNDKLEQAKAKAEEAQKRLHDLFMQAPAMIAVVRGPDFEFEMANPLYLQIVGKTKAIIGKKLLKVFPELTGQGILDILRDVYNTGKPFIGNEVPVKIDKNNDGNLEDIYFTFVYQSIKDSKNKINGVMTHAVDVTQHVEARKHAEESEAQFRFMAESLPQKIFTANPKGEVTYFNPQWADYTGLPMEKIRQEGVKHFVHPDDLSENMRLWRQAIKDGQPLQNEQRLRRFDGQYRRHISHVKAMRDDDGNIMRWFGSMTDIEDITQTLASKKELELKTSTLQEQRAQLIAINSAKDEFISLASHQLRTPATSVKQYIGMILEGYAGDVTSSQKDFLQRAYSSNERQLKIINDLLKVALVDAGKIKPKVSRVKLAPLIGEIIEGQAAKLAEKKQKVLFQSNEDLCVVSADADLLRMALENLIDNASKYSYEDKEITVKLKKSKGNADITIQDEGVGIPKDKLDKLFRKFSRLDNPLSVAAGGTGLGLYWVKKIIELHKGSIRVDSQEAKGSIFTVVLPA